MKLGLNKKDMSAIVKKNSMLLVCLAIVAFFSIITQGMMLRPMNISNILVQNAYIIIVATGMLCCILTGGNVDLSSGAVAGLLAVVCGKFVIEFGVNPIIGIIAVLFFGLLIGMFSGSVIAFLHVPPFIATLAAFSIWQGLMYVLLDGKSYSIYPETFKNLFTGFIPDFFNGENIHITTIILGIMLCALIVVLDVLNRKEKIKYGIPVSSKNMAIAKYVVIIAGVMFLTYSFASYKGMPIVLFTVGIVVALYTFILEKTVIGRQLYAVCGNRKAAQLSGIRDDLILFAAYVNISVLVAIAAMVYTARIDAATSTIGINWHGDAIAACYIGGASPKTGKGTVIGAMLGALVIGLLNNGMALMGLNSNYQLIVKGLVLIVAVYFDTKQNADT